MSQSQSRVSLSFSFLFSSFPSFLSLLSLRFLYHLHPPFSQKNSTTMTYIYPNSPAPPAFSYPLRQGVQKLGSSIFPANQTIDSTETSPKADRQRRNKRQRTSTPADGPEEEPNFVCPPDQSEGLGSGSFLISGSSFVDPQDPADRLRRIVGRVPPEIWHLIFSFMPTSHVPAVSLVSRAMLDICRTWPRWRFICLANNLGEPKRKYRSYMALVCSEALYICDMGDSRSTGTGQFRSSELPLPVLNREDGQVWRLCIGCRWAYYDRYPELEVLQEIDANSQVSGLWVRKHLFVDGSHMKILNPTRNHSNWAINKLTATEYALEIHGGHVGLMAVKNKVCKSVRIKYRQRKKEDGARPGRDRY